MGSLFKSIARRVRDLSRTWHPGANGDGIVM